MNVITSEKRRLRSLQEKKQSFKAKGQLIQQALSNLDNTTNNKKIIFDDVDKQQSSKPKEKTKRDLFDSDDDSNNEKDSLWNKDEFKVKKSKKITLGNDARFTLDDRFTEDNCQTEENKIVKDECNLQKEKEKQLDILESILGTPLNVKRQETKPAKKGLMIRYDPTENGHCEYEVKPAQLETKEKSTKKKKHKFVPEIVEPSPPEPEVSTDIYYAVSDALVESLNQKEEFSLLKAYGKEKDDTENTKDNDASTIKNNKMQKFRFNFNANNAFKHDSSDDEDKHEAPDIDNEIVDETKEDTQQNSLFGYKDTLFFDSNDTRFNEAITFFSIETASNDQLNNLRRKLKTIVRMKVRNNERKRQPFGKKRKIKKSH